MKKIIFLIVCLLVSACGTDRTDVYFGGGDNHDAGVDPAPDAGTNDDPDAGTPPECVRDSDCPDDDDLWCNGTQVCRDNECVPGPEPCAGDTVCDEDLDQCLGCDDNLDCDDGNYCNGKEVCNDDGACESVDEQCSPDFCVGGDCVECTCDDDCGAGENCNNDGECVCDPPQYGCDDGDPCNGVEVWDEDSCSCQQLYPPLDCDDGDKCTDDTCTANGCSNEPIVCDDGDACTTDSCDAVEGCIFEPIVCDDGFHCQDGDCVYDDPDPPDPECTTHTDCTDPLARKCDDGVCVQCTGTWQCTYFYSFPEGTTCDTDTNLCALP